MNKDFPINPEELDTLRMRIGMVSTMLSLAKNEAELKALEDTDWGVSMLRNLTVIGCIFTGIVDRHNTNANSAEALAKDKDLSRLVAEEAKANPDHRFTLIMDMPTASVFVTSLQLATRHPHFQKTANCKLLGKTINAIIDMAPDELVHFKALLRAGNHNPQSPDFTS